MEESYRLNQRTNLDFLVIVKRIDEIENFISKDGYASYDPYDGLTAPFVDIRLNKFCLRCWQQFIKLTPVNVRPVLGIKKAVHTKTLSDFSSGFSLLYKMTSEEKYRDLALAALQQLEQAGLSNISGIGWGLRFPIVTRFVLADEHTCNVFTTLNAIHAFLDAYEVFGDVHYLEIALQGIEFSKYEFGYKVLGDAMLWNYWKGLESGVYNVNGLILGLMARMYALIGDEQFRGWVEKLLQYLRRGQNSDGSWFYSDDKRGRWIDGFHLGYILEGMCLAIQAGIMDRNESSFCRGVEFYSTRMFTPLGLPRYYSQDVYPVDVQNAAQAIQTLAYLCKLGLCSATRLFQTFKTVEEALWNPRGYYNYMKTRLWTIKIPMHRWGTGPMFLALVRARALLTSPGKDTREVGYR
jgi:hypothetical protein